MESTKTSDDHRNLEDDDSGIMDDLEPTIFTSNLNVKLSNGNDCSSPDNFTEQTGPCDGFFPTTIKINPNIRITVSTTPIRSVHDLHQVFSPHPEKGEVTANIAIPRLVVTKATPVKQHHEIPKSEEVLKKNVQARERKLVFKNF